MTVHTTLAINKLASTSAVVKNFLHCVENGDIDYVTALESMVLELYTNNKASMADKARSIHTSMVITVTPEQAAEFRRSIEPNLYTPPAIPIKEWADKNSFDSSEPNPLDILHATHYHIYYKWFMCVDHDAAPSIMNGRHYSYWHEGVGWCEAYEIDSADLQPLEG